MLCVSSGVIEILSKENDDTPIISFTSGTILCEFSLFMPHPIRTTVRAATIVELQILDTIDFYHLVLKYPENFASMRDDVLERFKDSRKINVDVKIRTLDPEENVNYRLQKLKKVTAALRKDGVHVEDNIGVRRDSSSGNLGADVMNMYTLSENIPRIKTVPITLVRNKPWILRPGTPLLNLWQSIIFIIVTIVIFFYPYQVAFVRIIDSNTNTLLIFVQIVYVLDIMIQCITAVPRNDLVSYKTSIREIISWKLKSYGFYLDILSSYHLEVFTPLFHFGSLDYRYLLLAQNKLLKIWFIPVFFKRIEEELSTNLIIIRMFKTIYFVTWLIHFCSAVVNLEACPMAECHPDRWFSNLQNIEAEQKIGKPYSEYPYFMSLYVALMGISSAGIGNVLPSCMEDIYTVMFLITLGLITFSYCIAEISVTFKHRERKTTEFQEQLFATDRFLVEHNLPDDLCKRVSKYLQIQWNYDKGATIKTDIPIDQLPSKLRKNMLLNRLRILQAIPIFKNANTGFMVVLAKGCKVRIIPENEMVVYAGGIDKEMYILQHGYCRVTENDRSWVIGPMTTFGEQEMIKGIPVTMSVKTLTHTRIICIEYSTYLRAVTKYSNVRKNIEALMETNAPNLHMSLYQVSYDLDNDDKKHTKMPLAMRIKNSFTNSIINVYKYDKRLGLNYWTPFMAWRKVHFLKYMFLPFDIKPDSVFLNIWMAIRITASVVMGFLTPIYFSIPAFISYLRPVIIFLQIITWLDLYLTCHVAYYDNKGILTFHPAKTVVHYLQSNFALDLLLVFPYFGISGVFEGKNQSPNLLVNGLGLIKVFQYYKFLQACNYHETGILRRADTFKLLKYLPTILMITTTAAAILIQIECEIFDPNEPMPKGGSTLAIYRRTIENHCSYKQKKENTSHADTTEDFYLFIIASYWITSTMSSTGFGDIVAHDIYTLSVCIFVILVGVFLYWCLFSSIASSGICIHYNVIKCRARMKEMMMFLEKEKTSKKMQDRFFKQYLYVWDRTLGHMPQNTLSHIHTALKQDIVDCMYEKTLRKVSIFTFTQKPFTRSIGKYIDEVHFLKGETIIKHNHILQDIYIIYKGEIYVIGPDNKFITYMGAGGPLGNISETSYKLSSITAISATKVELLRFKNEDFQRTLMNYPAVRLRIMATIKKNEDYILPYMENDPTLNDIDIEIPEDEFPTGAVNQLTRDLGEESVWADPGLGNTPKGHFYIRGTVYRPAEAAFLHFVILSNSWLHEMIRIITIIFAYSSSILTSYVFAFQDFRFYVLVPYYALDIVFYIKIYLELHYTYIDNRGDHMYIMRAIKKRYLSSKRFYIDLFANIPFDIFALLAPSELRYTVASFLRLNRLIRFYYIIEFYQSQLNSLVTKIILLEAGTLVAWISFMIHLISCIWYMAACPIFFCRKKSWLTEVFLEASEKFEQYITSIYYMVTLITNSGYGDIIPQNELEIVLTTVIIITSHFAMVLCSASFLAMTAIQSLNFIKYDESVVQLRRDLTRQKVNIYQITKLSKYLQLLWLRENGRQIPKFIQSAPYIMKCDVYSAMYGEHVSSSQRSQRRDLNENFLRQLTIYMVGYVFFPGNYIVQQGDNDGTMYFIHKGEVSVMTIHKDLMETIHYNVKENEQFGITQGLVFGQPHQFSYRAETEVEILSLTLSHWQHLFKYFPQVKSIIYDRLNYIN